MRTAKIETKDEKVIIELDNLAWMYMSVTSQYVFLLEEGKQKSQDLINVFQTDYDIKKFRKCTNGFYLNSTLPQPKLLFRIKKRNRGYIRIDY